MSDHRVPVRWQDIDGNGHVSHVAFLTYLEEGRDACLAGHGIGRDEYLVGRCTMTWRREITPDMAEVVVRCEVASVGRTSIATRELLLSDAGDVLAEAEFGVVVWDPATRRPRPLSESERASLRAN
jgi:acyl-CoA thioesterase FadM